MTRAIGRALYVAQRYLQGARRVDTSGDLDGTAGSIYLPGEGGIEIQFGGACPVQGEGSVTILGVERECYYRSRGEGWEFSVAGPSGDVFGSDAWCYWERPYLFPDGGWVARHVSRECIMRALRRYQMEVAS